MTTWSGVGRPYSGLYDDDLDNKDVLQHSPAAIRPLKEARAAVTVFSLTFLTLALSTAFLLRFWAFLFPCDKPGSSSHDVIGFSQSFAAALAPWGHQR